MKVVKELSSNLWKALGESCPKTHLNYVERW